MFELEFTIHQNVNLSAVFIAAYLMAAYLIKDDEIYKCTMACVGEQIIGLSPAYNALMDNAIPFYEFASKTHSQSFVFAIYAAVYFALITQLKSSRVKIACYAMAIFECVMYKAYRDEFISSGFEAWLCDYDSHIVTLLHACIIFQVAKWSGLLVRCTDYCRRVLRSVVYFCHSLLA